MNGVLDELFKASLRIMRAEVFSCERNQGFNRGNMGVILEALDNGFEIFDVFNGKHMEGDRIRGRGIRVPVLSWVVLPEPLSGFEMVGGGVIMSEHTDACCNVSSGGVEVYDGVSSEASVSDSKVFVRAANIQMCR